MSRVCGSCRFWEESVREDRGELGTCRRYAPRPQVEMLIPWDDSEYHPAYPLTMLEDWCGEWVSREGLARD